MAAVAAAVGGRVVVGFYALVVAHQVMVGLENGLVGWAKE